MKIKAVIWEEDGAWCASVPALPGCHTWAETKQDLDGMIKEAVQGWLEVAAEREQSKPGEQILEVAV